MKSGKPFILKHYQASLSYHFMQKKEKVLISMSKNYNETKPCLFIFKKDDYFSDPTDKWPRVLKQPAVWYKPDRTPELKPIQVHSCTVGNVYI